MPVDYSGLTIGSRFNPTACAVGLSPVYARLYLMTSLPGSRSRLMVYTGLLPEYIQGSINSRAVLVIHVSYVYECLLTGCLSFFST